MESRRGGVRCSELLSGLTPAKSFREDLPGRQDESDNSFGQMSSNPDKCKKQETKIPEIE